MSMVADLGAHAAELYGLRCERKVQIQRTPQSGLVAHASMHGCQVGAQTDNCVSRAQRPEQVQRKWKPESCHEKAQLRPGCKNTCSSVVSCHPDYVHAYIRRAEARTSG